VSWFKAAGAQHQELHRLHQTSQCSFNTMFLLSLLACVFHLCRASAFQSNLSTSALAMLSLVLSSRCCYYGAANPQVLGLFTVGVTATGCLYFMDTTNVANPRGLDAVGVLLLLLNILYVIAMAMLVLVTGAHKTKRFGQTAVRSFQSGASRFGRSVSTSFARLRLTRGSSSGRPGTGPVLGDHTDSSASASMNGGLSSSVNGSGSSSIWHYQRTRAGGIIRGSSTQLSLLPPATDSSITPPPEWVIPDDLEILQDTEHDRTIRDRLPVLSVLPHEHRV